MDPELANGLAGIASLVTSLLLVPTIVSLRKIAAKHDERMDKHEQRLDGHDRDIAALKPATTPKTRARGKRGLL